MKHSKILFIGMLLIMSLFSCGNQAKNTTQNATKSVVFGTINPRTAIDLHTNHLSTVFTIQDHMVQPLYGLDNNLLAYPILVTDFPLISEDGLVYRMTLKDDIHFHNGQPLTMEDVQFSFERIFNPESPSISLSSYTMIEGANQMLEGQSDHLSGFKVIDDRTFEIHLSEPFSPFINNLAMGYAGIIPKAAYLANADQWGLDAIVGTGPYQLIKHSPQNGVIMERFEEYHGQRPDLDRIEFRYFNNNDTALLEYESGNIDMIILPIEKMEYYQSSKYANELHLDPLVGTYMLIVNFDDPYFSNPLVREAFAYALDREEIRDISFKNSVNVTDNFLPKGIQGRNDQIKMPSYNPQRSRELLAEAGYPNGISVKATFSAGNNPYKSMLSLVQAKAKDAGFSIEVEELDVAMRQELMTQGKLTITPIGWMASYLDADYFFFVFFHSSHSKTLSSNYNNPQMDRMLELAQVELDPLKRKAMYEEIEMQIIGKDFAVYPIVDMSAFFLMKPYIKNFQTHNGIYYLWDVDLDLDQKAQHKH